jgi:hypothetical protein
MDIESVGVPVASSRLSPGAPSRRANRGKMPGRHQFSRVNGSSASSTAPSIISIRPPSSETCTSRTGVLSQTHASGTSSPAVGALPGSSTGPLRGGRTAGSESRTHDRAGPAMRVSEQNPECASELRDSKAESPFVRVALVKVRYGLPKPSSLAEPMAQREGKRRRCASQPRVTRSSVSSRSRRSPNT